MASGEPLRSATPRPANGRTSARRGEVRPHLHEALVQLLQAYEYALELDQDVWDFAVELPVLRSVKLSNSDLRWLVGMGYVEHAVETTGPADCARQFRRTPLVTFTSATCLALTPSGAVAAHEARDRATILEAHRQALPGCKVVVADEQSQSPKWDQQRRQLRVGADIVKEFKLPSPNQETVLTAFEEEEWPPRIDDPLPPLPQLDPRRRLHDTIKALNRKQKHDLIRFMGDGSGEGVRWELTDKVGVVAS